MKKKQASHARLALAVFSFTLFLSASLMFSVQPMVGKMLLPLVGGTPAGWIVAMAFFQIMLLVGYLVAHLFSTVVPRKHGLLYLLGLLLGVFFLPVSFANHIFTDTPGAWQVFLLLTQCVAVPFIALSATSSTIQRLFTVTKHSASDDPYFLYVASNLGSFTGLLLYPVLIEPLLTLDHQAQCLEAGYILLMLMGAACLGLGSGKEAKPPKSSGRMPPNRTLAQWAALAFVPSSLLMGVTAYITTDVISAPMVWIIPLALYLLTFVIAFSKKPIVSLGVMQRIHPYAICVAIFVISLMQARWLGGWWGVSFYLIIFVAVTLACHMRLASLRPLSDGRHLTAFYLMMSVGGALGGVLNAFIVPNVFNRLIEFPLMLLGSIMLHPDFKAKSRAGMAMMGLLGISVLLVNAPAMQLGFDSVTARLTIASAVIMGSLALLPMFNRVMLKPMSLTLGAMAVFMVAHFCIADDINILTVRNFYGTIRVYDGTANADGKTYVMRNMRHGSTVHGMQVIDPKLSLEPTAYHAKAGPLGDVFRAFKPKKVAVLGLGVGAMNCYNAPDREFTFFEIDPAVVDVAENQFTFLSACKSKTPPRILVGDGRLELMKLTDEKFDLLAMDAFTSDSIPTHLITKEAFALYFQHIADGGVLAVNISNRYFSLWDTIAATAATLGLKSELRIALLDGHPFYATNSLWMVVAKKDVNLSGLGKHWQTVKPGPNVDPWTDNYTDLFSTLALTGNMRMQP